MVFIVFVAAFPTGPSVCWGGGGGQQAFCLSSKHKLWNFHRYLLVLLKIRYKGFKTTKTLFVKFPLFLTVCLFLVPLQRKHLLHHTDVEYLDEAILGSSQEPISILIPLNGVYSCLVDMTATKVKLSYLIRSWYICISNTVANLNPHIDVS